MDVRMKHYIDTFDDTCKHQVALISAPKPPWLIKKLTIIWDLHRFNKQTTSSNIFKISSKDFITFR